MSDCLFSEAEAQQARSSLALLRCQTAPRLLPAGILQFFITAGTLNPRQAAMR